MFSTKSNRHVNEIVECTQVIKVITADSEHYFDLTDLIGAVGLKPIFTQGNIYAR